MKPATYLLVTLLCTDAIAWATFIGIKPALIWLAAAIGVWLGHKWVEREDSKIPTRRMRSRPA